MFGRIVGALERVFRWVTTALFLTMLAAVLLQIVARYALPSAPVWTEELTRFALIFMTAFACGNAVRRRELVNVDIFINMLPSALRRAVLTVVDVVTLAFGVAFFYYTIEYVQRTVSQQATTMPFSMAWIASSVLLIAGVLALFTFANLIDDFAGREEKAR